MSTIRRFEEMDIWQMARKQCAHFFELAKSGQPAGQVSLKDQMDISSGSVMDNIAEGFDRHSRADFRHFLVLPGVPMQNSDPSFTGVRTEALFQSRNSKN